MKIVVIGGVAAGMSAAARARRLSESAEIVVLEAGPYVSFANCGLPYHLGEEIQERSALLLHTPDTLRAQLNLDVRVNHLVTRIDRVAKQVEVTTPQGPLTLPYDRLILAPGADPIVPPVEGFDHAAVAHLRTIDDLDALKGRVDELAQAPGGADAVVIGAGFIGLEAAEALVHRGLRVQIVDLADHVLPPLDSELAPLLARELEAHGVGVHLGVAATSIRDSGKGVEVALSNGEVLQADTVVANVGVKPRTELARECGLELTERGAIIVDGAMRTSDEYIWAAGDAVAVRQSIGGHEIIGSVPLASPANRHGRLIANSIFRPSDAPAEAPAVLGTAIVRVFGLTAAVTGANQQTLERLGVTHHVVHTHHADHAGYYPGATTMHLVASFGADGKLLGAQGVGVKGVDKRIDVLATALRAGLGADELADLDLCYSPPFGSAKDPVNMIGFIAQNILDGTMPQWYTREIEDKMANTLILDARSAAEFAGGHIPGALNVPHTQVRERLEEIRREAAGRPISVICQSGLRSYLATRVLLQNGFDAANHSGSMLTFNNERPDLVTRPGSGA